MLIYIKNITTAFVNLIKSLIIYKFNHNTALSLDRLGNTVIFEGDPNLTISQHSALARKKFMEGKSPKIWGCLICKALSYFDTEHVWPNDHCNFSITGLDIAEGVVDAKDVAQAIQNEQG